MANQEHLDVLKQGVEVWNQWRQEHPDLWPNLNRANLSGADLKKVDLQATFLKRAQFQGANLSGASLDRTYLERADFTAAHLRGVHLRGAYLYGTNFTSANLTKADLREANLGKAILNRANLSKANLNFVNLAFAILTHANLRETDLYQADLLRADLTGADLTDASLARVDFTSADLASTNLTQAYLLNAIFEESNLTDTDFSHSDLGFTAFGDVDLRTVKGLETINHNGPSTIGIDTIIRSQGNIPEIFLRKAGVPQSIIEQISALVGSLKPFDYYTCFISYSSRDEAFAKRLYADLQSNGVRCWFAPKDLKIGDKIRPRIDESIRIYDKLLLILSQHSVASQWVEQEIETALEKERKEGRIALFPIRLDKTVMEIEGGWPALIRNTRYIGDFTRWKDPDDCQEAFGRLLRDLKAEV